MNIHRDFSVDESVFDQGGWALSDPGERVGTAPKDWVLGISESRILKDIIMGEDSLWGKIEMQRWWCVGDRIVFQFVLNQGLQTSCLICWTGTQASVVFLEIDQLNMWFKFRASWRFTNWANQNIVFSSCLSREKFYYIGCFVCFRFHGMWCLWTLLEHQTWSWHWWWGNTTLLMRWLRFYRQACFPLIQCSLDLLLISIKQI